MLNKGRTEEELFTFFAQKKSEDIDHRVYPELHVHASPTRSR